MYFLKGGVNMQYVNGYLSFEASPGTTFITPAFFLSQLSLDTAGQLLLNSALQIKQPSHRKARRLKFSSVPDSGHPAFLVLVINRWTMASSLIQYSSTLAPFEDNSLGS